MPRLVIPAGDTAESKAPWGPTWAEVAAEARADIAVLGDDWCKARGIDGLGIVDDAPTAAPTDPTTPILPLPTLPEGLLEAAGASVSDVEAKLAALLDPTIANPTQAVTLSTLASAIALLIARIGR